MPSPGPCRPSSARRAASPSRGASPSHRAALATLGVGAAMRGKSRRFAPERGETNEAVGPGAYETHAGGTIGGRLASEVKRGGTVAFTSDTTRGEFGSLWGALGG